MAAIAMIVGASLVRKTKPIKLDADAGGTELRRSLSES